MKIDFIRAILVEYGLPWVINRSLYALKLKLMKVWPIFEKIFEKQVHVKRVDIYKINVDELSKFLINLSDQKKNDIINTADQAISGKIKAFSSMMLDYGNPIRWNYNPITNQEISNSLKWYNISDFDSMKGDIKVVWEASRFTHFFFFTRAYLITKNKKYYDAFSQQLNNWLESNHYSYGANYKCGQEASLRMITAIIAFCIFKSCGLSTETDEKNIKKLVCCSYKKVLSNFFYAHKCIKNNHTLSEITGLIVGAWCCEDSRKMKKSYKLLEKEILKQFFDDGGYIQYSFNYQRFALQLIEFVLKISNTTNIHLSDRIKNRIRNSVELMYQVQDLCGDLPNYGSNDGALIFPVTVYGYRDFRPVVNTLYSLLDGKRLYCQDDYDEELLWFTEKKVHEFPQTSISRTSAKFIKAGIYTIRHEEGFLLVVLQKFSSRPGQMDQLHIDLWHKGLNILCDSGTYSYATDIGKQLSLTAAHNTVQIDNKEQMRKRDPFLIYDWTYAENITHKEDYFSGTMISKNGYSHTRSIKKYGTNYFIEDDIRGTGKKCVFHFHTPCQINITENGLEFIDNGLKIAFLKTRGSIHVDRKCRSLYYLQGQEINHISICEELKNNRCKMLFEIQLY